MANIDKITNEFITAISVACELDDDTIAALNPIIKEVVKNNIESLTPVAPTPVEKSTKVTKPRTKKTDVIPDDKKISTKTGYHFFVAAKMSEIKDKTNSKERMGVIGAMWKKVSEDNRQPYQACSKFYNEIIDNEMKNDGWQSRRREIVSEATKRANEHLKTLIGITLEPVADAEPKEDDEEEITDDKPSEVVEPEPEPEPKPVPKKTTRRKSPKNL